MLLHSNSIALDDKPIAITRTFHLDKTKEIHQHNH